jgi:hypothetical protein
MLLSSAELRARLAERLADRRNEIEQAILARVYGISNPAEVEDPAYAVGLRQAVTAGLDYGLAALEPAHSQSATVAPVPVQLLFQARYAAHLGVSLDTVLRRYFAGFALLGDFIVQEANEEVGIPAPELQRALRGEAVLFDRLIATVSEEYGREAKDHRRSNEESRTAKVRRLLAGELVDSMELDYDIDAWHLGAIAAGSGARVAIRDFAKTLDCRLLMARADDGTVWGWFGAERTLASREVLRLAGTCWPADATLAIGEAGQGIEGWRKTHRQAKAAIQVAQRGEKTVVAYADVALFAAALNDELLAGSLQDIYLTPLERERDGGVALRQTLHAYMAAGRNASAAAASLGVSRKTVSIRVRIAETRIGRSLDSCAAELETALRLRSVLLAPLSGC